MSETHKKRLRKVHRRFVTDLELGNSTLLSRLYEKEAISRLDMERVEAIKDPSNQRIKLLQTIARRHDGAFIDLVKALIEDNQGHLAHDLDPTGRFVSEKTLCSVNIFYSCFGIRFAKKQHISLDKF